MSDDDGLEEFVMCEDCEKEYDDSTLRYCPDCGAHLAVFEHRVYGEDVGGSDVDKCPECDEQVESDWDYCGHCGEHIWVEKVSMGSIARKFIRMVG